MHVTYSFLQRFGMKKSGQNYLILFFFFFFPFLFMAFWSQSSEDLHLAGDLGAVLVLLSW